METSESQKRLQRVAQHWNDMLGPSPSKLSEIAALENEWCGWSKNILEEIYVLLLSLDISPAVATGIAERVHSILEDVRRSQGTKVVLALESSALIRCLTSASTGALIENR